MTVTYVYRGVVYTRQVMAHQSSVMRASVTRLTLRLSAPEPENKLKKKEDAQLETFLLTAWGAPQSRTPCTWHKPPRRYLMPSRRCG